LGRKTLHRNIVQAAVGAALGSGLAVVVHRAYPPVRDLRW
jgi:hypothetical protein